MYLPNECPHYHMFYRIEGAGSYLVPMGIYNVILQGCCLHPCYFPWIGARVMEWEMGEHYTYAHLIQFFPLVMEVRVYVTHHSMT